MAVVGSPADEGKLPGQDNPAEGSFVLALGLLDSQELAVDIQLQLQVV